jgi:hypothetical protein
MPASGTAGDGGRAARGRRVVVTAARVLGVVASLVWVCTVWRLAADPGEHDPVVEAFVAGGWGLSLLPVHVTTRRPRRRTRGGRRRPSPDRRIFAAQGRGVAGSGWQRGHQ